MKSRIERHKKAGRACAIACLLAFSGNAAAQDTFRQFLTYNKVKFLVEATRQDGGSRVTITPSGLTESNEAVRHEIAGSVTFAEVDDIDGDGNPEVYVHGTPSAVGGAGIAIGYAVNNGKSISEIYIPPIAEDAKYSQGYRGSDESRVVEGRFMRRFPLYDA